MASKREYERIKVTASAVLFFKSEEYAADLIDVSETGVGIQLEKKIPNIKINDVFNFHATDKYELYNIEKSNFLIESARVVRIMENEKGFFIGCELITPSENFIDYVSNRKVAIFFNNNCKMSIYHPYQENPFL